MDFSAQPTLTPASTHVSTSEAFTDPASSTSHSDQVVDVMSSEGDITAMVAESSDTESAWSNGNAIQTQGRVEAVEGVDAQVEAQGQDTSLPFLPWKSVTNSAQKEEMNKSFSRLKAAFAHDTR
ncbi:hypothetical protein BT69DRAFT_1294475 [Atractiella rhizophila]|nr:hypothetical protein BT69DRAFT_1294475 [Atractiella rhizophila]